MKFSFKSISIAFLVFLIVACNPSQKQVVEQKIQNTADHFAPDSRVAMFDILAETDNGGWILRGETDLSKAKAALLDTLSNLGVSVIDSIKVLPASELNGDTLGIVNNSVANIRSEPSHPAQLVTQATLGMPLKVLKKDGGWYLVQTPDDYLGWIDSGGFEAMTAKEFEVWKTAPKMIYLDVYGFAYEDPSVDSPQTSDLVSGSILELNGTEGDYYHVSYPDGRTGYVSHSEARSFDDWKASVEVTQDRLIQTARTMKGAPYLWGGTSSKGMDCSGFTKTIYFMSGWIIPRDASQQVRAGRPVNTSDGFDNLQPGDLLFFGRPATDSTSQRVVHVGMWIGNNEFIHSSGRVRISSVDPAAENYDEYNLNRYLETKRYLHQKQGNIINVEDMYDI